MGIKTAPRVPSSGPEIREMFSVLAPAYETFNRRSSLGLDKMWRARLASLVTPGAAVLDLGAGTGDLSRLLYGRGARVVGADFSGDMLRQARRSSPDLRWCQSGAEALAFQDGAFDVVLSAFVLRNLQQGAVLPAAARETARVLKPGGRMLFLDLTRPRSWFLRLGHGFYTRIVLPLVGRWSFGRHWPGAYLRGSIEALWPEEKLRTVFLDAGFRHFRVTPWWGGLVSLFEAER